jgi:hypothetical protein
MKQKDVALIIIIAFVSAVISFVVSGKLFASGASRQQEHAVVDKIETTFDQPDSKYFNKQSIDPAQSVQIGNNNNDNPFSGN